MQQMPHSSAPSGQCPPGTKKAVQFDTNAYRDLTFGLSLDEIRARVAEVRRAEASTRVFALANPIAIFELVEHVADPTDTGYKQCLGALVALGEHTKSPTASDGSICVFTDPETNVCRQLFGAHPPNRDAFVQSLSRLAARVRDDAPSMTDPALLHNLKVFAGKLKRKEAAWLGDMKSHVLNFFRSDEAQRGLGGKDAKDTRRRIKGHLESSVFMDKWAEVMAYRYGQILGLQLKPEDLPRKAKILKEVFSAPFYLLLGLLEKFLNPDFNLLSPKRNRGNYIWDYAICHAVGPNHMIGTAPMYLVTSDEAIIDAAAKAGCGNRVICLKDYLQSLGLQAP